MKKVSKSAHDATAYVIDSEECKKPDGKRRKTKSGLQFATSFEQKGPPGCCQWKRVD